MDRGLRARMFARSFLMQACWSFERMQNLGFLYALEPWLERVYPDPAERSGAALRHLEFFNTQPYMAGLILGVVGGLEERLARTPEAGRPAAAARLSAVKKALASTLAAVGDSLFWGSLKPACAAAAVAAWGLFFTLGWPRPVLFGCLLYLVLFNLPALWVRWEGLRLGHAWQERLPAELGRYRWKEASAALRASGLVLAGLCTAACLLVPPWGTFTPWNLAVLFACLVLKPRGFSAAQLYLGLAFAGTALALARPA